MISKKEAYDIVVEETYRYVSYSLYLTFQVNKLVKCERFKVDFNAAYSNLDYTEEWVKITLQPKPSGHHYSNDKKMRIDVHNFLQKIFGADFIIEHFVEYCILKFDREKVDKHLEELGDLDDHIESILGISKFNL